MQGQDMVPTESFRPRRGLAELRYVCEHVSVRSRQTEYALGDKTHNEMWRDRRNARDHAFAEIALDMKFLGVAVAAVGHHRGLAGFKTRLGAEIFRGIGGRSARNAIVVLPGRFHRHELSGFKLHPALRQRMLDRLVLSDRATEHHALPGVSRGAL